MCVRLLPVYHVQDCSTCWMSLHQITFYFLRKITCIGHTLCLNKTGEDDALLLTNAFWRLWNTMYLDILLNIEHLLKCSIFYNFFKSIPNFTYFFLYCFSMLSKHRKWSHDLKMRMEYRVKHYILREKSLAIIYEWVSHRWSLKH